MLIIRILICEDDKQYRQLLQRYILQYSLLKNRDLEIVLCTGDVNQVKHYINTSKVECYILDIDLNSYISGLKLAQLIREKDSLADIIFVTAYADKLKLTFKYRLAALDYIIKDNSNLQESLFKALDASYNKLIQLYGNNSSNYFTIKIGEYIRKINFHDIYYFETSSNAHKVILKERNGVYEFYNNLSEVEASLDESFFRCHRSYIVNLNHIQFFDKKNRCLSLNNGERCPVAYSKKNTLQNLLGNMSLKSSTPISYI